ncbi:MAG TPA: carbon storage regulator [Steroidobacteraceae bacterium]|jgi:carbon storage regulator|nr:carbon storage regulator [Steroidobacteraceae bacterium]
MLILTRRLTETLTIGDDITITVMAIKGSRVRIGIHAPGMAVRRAEAKHRAAILPPLIPQPRARVTLLPPRRPRESRP